MVILWDFDGVILNSMPIRDKGFTEVLKEYPIEQVDELLDYHRANGGLSRYVKFRYFFEKIRNEGISDEEVNRLAQRFSSIMLDALANKELIIKDSYQFIENHYKSHEMHIVSGSDQAELRQLCVDLSLSNFFKSINGSPTPKKQLVANILNEYAYNKGEVVLIGDSYNDFEAAQANNIPFIGYNNSALKEVGEDYVDSFKEHFFKTGEAN